MLQPNLGDHTYKVHLLDRRVQYINGVIHQLPNNMDSYVEKVNFHVVNFRSADVTLSYLWFYNTNPSLSKEQVSHSILLSLNHSQHFMHYVKPSIISNTLVHLFSILLVLQCILHPNLQIYMVTVIN